VSNEWRRAEWNATIKKHMHLNKEMLGGELSRDHAFCVQLLNNFLHFGPNGKHFVMVFEIMGVTLLQIMKSYKYKGVSSNHRFPFQL
jgi:hypothetical protein